MKKNFALLAAVCLGVIATSGCEPWGKPEQPETPAADITDFQTLFSKNCTGCHGTEGKNGPARILNDALYLKLIPREELHKVLVYGRPGTQMPAWLHSQGGPLNEKQIDALVDGIYRSWSKPFNARGTEMPQYAGQISDGDVSRGKKLFARNCYMCHGPGAAVGLVSSASYLELVSNQMLRTSIIVGRPDLGMPNYQNLKAGHALENQDVSDLVTYLASLRPANALTADRHTNESGGNNGTATGEKGSGNGPGSPQKDQVEGTKHVNSSVQGGTIEQRKEQH